MAFRPYLAFAGNCREAFTRYQEIFGGELALLTSADMPPAPEGSPMPPSDTVMHAALTSPIGLLLGAEDPSGGFDGHVRGMCINVALDDTGEAKRVYDALSEGGDVQMPLGETFFSPAFGMCMDRFGQPWMVMVEAPANPER
jgi:PhnB protein